LNERRWNDLFSAALPLLAPCFFSSAARSFISLRRFLISDMIAGESDDNNYE
jgi:hypothetical protein